MSWTGILTSLICCFFVVYPLFRSDEKRQRSRSPQITDKAEDGFKSDSQTDEMTDEKNISLRKAKVTAARDCICPNCGKIVHQSDKFCSQCGAQISKFS